MIFNLFKPKTKVVVDEKKIEEILFRSVNTIYPSKEDLKKKLMSGKQLRVYMGIDPTATYAHLGHSTNYIILKRLHELGHKIIVLVGDFTAMIGDPSDKNSARKQLTKKEVLQNLKTFKVQIGKILPFDDKENPIDFVFNSKWLGKLKFSDLLELASQFTVQQMIERDNFEKRLKENKPLYVHEFFYPLMQGYDSVALKVDLEIGGTDQTFNMLAGRTLVKNYQKRDKFVMSTTLLENPVTGEKLMSKSLGTGIALDETAENMFGKVMNLPDEAIMQVFIDCTYLSMDEIDGIENELQKGANPRDIKLRLAKEIVTIYHGIDLAQKAYNNFISTFSNKEIPSDVAELVPQNYDLLSVLLESKFVSSKSEARRVLEQKGIKVDGVVVTDEKLMLQKGQVLQKGKIHFVKIV